MSRLFTYTIPCDDGAAPNPFHGICTLAICKPYIRRVAQINDWVVGLGSKNAPSGDLSGYLVYAMRVEEVLSLKEYDLQASSRWPHRIPNTESSDPVERLGDCIYDYSSGLPVQRKSVHSVKNIDTDLRGENVLISSDFYYFGHNAKELPNSLKAICHQTQGHRSNSNAQYLKPFELWVRSLALVSGQLYGNPDSEVEWKNSLPCGEGCKVRQQDIEGEVEVV